MFHQETIYGKRIYTSDLLKNGRAFFTTRDFCLCDKKELSEKEENIIKNDRKIISDFLSIEEENFLSPIQTHSTNIEVAEKNKKIYPDCDGLILEDDNLGVYLNYADCTPVILYDDIKNKGAVVHAGWRGTAGKIVQKAIDKMGSEGKNIIALIGPAIGFCCYDVGEDVFKKLSQTVDNFEGLYEIRQGKIFVDLKNINRRQLEEYGVERIDVCPYCTVCDNDKFYSYRKENKTTKRHSAVLKI